MYAAFKASPCYSTDANTAVISFQDHGFDAAPFMLIRILTLTSVQEEQSVTCLCLVTENTFTSFYQETSEKIIFTLPSLSTLGIS